MLEHDKKGNLVVDGDGQAARKTSHSLNKVPCIIFDADYQNDYELTLNENLGISSLGATCIELLGLKAPEGYDPSVINLK
jgi:2,3-bisphosphoglycerate-independent phosphoglycerate mutase